MCRLQTLVKEFVSSRIFQHCSGNVIRDEVPLTVVLFGGFVNLQPNFEVRLLFPNSSAMLSSFLTMEYQLLKLFNC